MPPVSRISLFQGNDFQTFCSVILSACDPTFQAVNGRGGDQGNDGFNIAGTVAYQAYGPAQLTIAKLRPKIDEALSKLAQHVLPSGGKVEKLVLLTPEDLSIEQHKYLQTAAAKAGIEAESWGHSRLLSLLARHPQIRSEFPEFLVPDLREMIDQLTASIRSEANERVAFPREPDIYVLQKNDNPDLQPHRAFRHFRLVVTGRDLRRDGFEPEAEDALLELVRTYFQDDEMAEIEAQARTASLIPIQHMHSALAFHTRWRWYSSGHFAIAGTLEDLNRPGTYSAADLAVQLARTLQVAALLGEGAVLVRFALNPHRLRVTLDPSDLRARARLGATLRGVHDIPRPQVDGESRTHEWELECGLTALRHAAHAVAGTLLVRNRSATHVLPLRAARPYALVA